MRYIPLLAGVLLFASAADAQLVGGQVGGALGGSAGALGSATGTLGATVDGTVRADPAVPQVDRPTVRTDKGKAVKVETGASLRVDRGTRCYYDDYYYDPVYRDGYYYCERSGTAVGAEARVGG